MTENRLRDRLEALHTAVLCDALDRLGCREASLGPTVRPLAGGNKVVGRAFTMRCLTADRVPDAPYSKLIEAFDHLSSGDVLVVQTGDEVSAMWGELLSTAARASGAVGAVLDGLIRDLDDIDALGFPVFGTGVSPADSAGRQEVVAFGEAVSCGLARIEPGDWILGDRMGVVVAPTHLAQQAVAIAEEKLAAESTVRGELARGTSLARVFERHGVL